MQMLTQGEMWRMDRMRRISCERGSRAAAANAATKKKPLTGRGFERGLRRYDFIINVQAACR
jgi:hypothetical protein